METSSGVSPGQAPAACCSPGCKSPENLGSLGERKKLRKDVGVLKEECTLVLCLKGFYLSSKGKNFRGGLNQNIHQLSRCVLVIF